MLKRLLLFLSFCFVSIGVAFGQNITVKGTVLDENNDPVMGATVRLKNDATKGAITDMDGRFTLQAKTGEIILVTYVGYKDQEVKAAPTLTVTLVPNDKLLDEVVVTALGLERQKRDLGYATTKINAEELTQAKSVDVASGLQGKVAGLNVAGLNSGVFSDVRITLRGIRSLTGNNNPMLLLDGVPVSLDFLSAINPNDVQNINILKGTSAASLYGPDARNGVIVVTTKSGSVGKPVITYGLSVQTNTVSFFPKFQEQFGSGGSTAYQFIPYENESWGPAYDGSERQLGKPDENGNVFKVPYSPTDERRKFFDTGLVIQNDLSFASKDFYLSAQDARITGIVPGDKNHRISLRTNAGKEFGAFKVGTSLNYIREDWDIFSSSGMKNYYSSKNVGMHDGIMDLVFATQAWVPLTQLKTDTQWGNYSNYYNEYSLNPYQAIETWREDGVRDRFIGNVDLKYSPFKWLDLSYRIALNYYNEHYYRKNPDVVPSAYAEENRGFRTVNQSVSDQTNGYYRLTSEPFANFHFDWDDYKLNAVLGSYYRETTTFGLGVAASPLVIPGLYNVSARTGEVTPRQRKTIARMLSFYGSIGFTYKDWLTLEVTGRNDKVSVLSPENNTFFYPGMNASVVLTDAIPALKSDYLNFFKLRVSWNKSGNSYLDPHALSRLYSQTMGFPYDGLVGYKASVSKVDPNLKPEFITSIETGFEATLFKNKATIDFTYYDQNNTNQVIDIAPSYASGSHWFTTNAAAFRNYGFEVGLKLNSIVDYNDFRVDLGANYGYNNSKINELYEGMTEISMPGYFIGRSVAVVGQPAFIYSVKDYKRDDAGHVIVDKNTGMPFTKETNVNMGRTMPLHILGLTASLEWKGIKLSTVFEYKGGYNTINLQGQTMAWDGQSRITAANSRERFVFPNSVYDKNQGVEGAAPEYVKNENVTINNNYGYFHEDFYRAVGTNFFFSANSWRWRELTLSYSLPQSLLAKTKVLQGVDLSFTARNLMLWLPRSNEWSDPDFSYSSDTNIAGTVLSSINPPTRTIGGSITLKF